jgi:ABC-2 type transport system permease protein
VLLVTASFLGRGLVVAALADDVPSVQALGQCLFLPMIMMGGVGIPLLALPAWAQRAAGFMPGRYAVELLQLAYCGSGGLRGGGFCLVALAAIGACAAFAGARLFRWEAGARIGGSAWAWISLALAAWAGVGIAAAMTGHLEPAPPPDIGYEAITDAEIGSVAYAGLPGDAEFVSRLAPPFHEGEADRVLGEFVGRLRDWGPGRAGDDGQRARNLVCVAAIADVGEDPHEGEIARQVFDQLRASFGDDRLRRILAWLILYPEAGSAVTSAPELGLGRQFTEEIIRERTTLYSTKYLGRLCGKIRDSPTGP